MTFNACDTVTIPNTFTIESNTTGATTAVVTRDSAGNIVIKPVTTTATSKDDVKKVETNTSIEVAKEDTVLDSTDTATTDHNDTKIETQALKFDKLPAVSSINKNNITVDWSLNEASTGQIEYGTTTDYGEFGKKEESFKYDNHKQVLTNLQSNTVYHYRVLSENKEGKKIVSDDNTFKTKNEVIVLDNVSSVDKNKTEQPTEISLDSGTEIEEYGVTCDGSNETEGIQKALDDYRQWKNGVLIFPHNQICSASGLLWGTESSTISGTENRHYIIEGNGATIKAQDNAPIGNMPNKSWILTIDNASYVDIKNLSLDGNREERGRLLSKYVAFADIQKSINQFYYNSNLVITHSKNILLENVTTNNAIEDGIYIGWRGGDATYPENITLKNCTALRAFRNNLTISNCINCKVEGGEYSYASGVSPQLGIDVECDKDPQNGKQCLQDITIEGTTMKENVGGAIAVAGKGIIKNIIIKDNYFDNNSLRETACDSHGSAISAGKMGGKSSIVNNTFINFTSRDEYIPAKGKEAACRSLIDFGASGPGYGGVLMENNKFENINGFKEDNKYLIYIHVYNDGKNIIQNNTFKNINDFTFENTTAGMLDIDWAYDGHKTDTYSTYENNRKIK